MKTILGTLVGMLAVMALEPAGAFDVQQLAACERHEHARLEWNASGGVNFATNELDRTLTIGWRNKIGESSDIHVEPSFSTAAHARIRSG